MHVGEAAVARADIDRKSRVAAEHVCQLRRGDVDDLATSHHTHRQMIETARRSHAEGVTAARPETVTFSCWGHPAIRGTHAKTVELTREREISARATCVVGVSADVEPAELVGFTGPLLVTLRAAGYEEVLRATAHPGFRLTESLVIRRSQHRSANTFATGADRGAKDLPRDLLKALNHTDTRLLVTVRGARLSLPGAGGRLTLLAVADGEAGGSLALTALADASLAVAGDAARQGVKGSRGDLDIIRPGGPATSRVLRELGSGGHVILALSPSLTEIGGREQELVREVAASGVPLQAIGFPVEVVALLLSGFRLGDSILIGRPDPTLDRLPRRCLVLWRLRSRSLSTVLGELERRAGDIPACAVLDVARPVEAVVRGTVSTIQEAVEGSTRLPGDVLLVLDTGRRSRRRRQARAR